MKTRGSGRPSPSKPFDPADIEPLSVFRCDYRFDGDPEPLPARRFVCLRHTHLQGQALALCLKATSNVAPYTNNPRRLQGVILYRAGELALFEKDTVIEPASLFPIPHYELIRQNLSGNVKILGTMPDGFAAVLRTVVQASVTMSPREKRRVLELLDVLG